jgi:YfiH family protein
VQHLFTTRQLALRPQAGTETAWAEALASVGAAPDRLRRVTQVHGRDVRVLARGRGSDHAAAARPDADALASNDPRLALAVMVADCVPIVIADAATGAVAAVHAGWRGTCAGIAATTVRALSRELGADPADMMAAIGPSIGPDDYEVGESLVTEFAANKHPQVSLDRWFSRIAGRLRLDLWTANRDQLASAGVRADRIYACGLSTLAHPEVFDSFRRDADAAGRMAAIVVVPD